MRAVADGCFGFGANATVPAPVDRRVVRNAATMRVVDGGETSTR